MQDEKQMIEVEDLTRVEWLELVHSQMKPVAEGRVPEVALGEGTVSIVLALTDEGARLLATKYTVESVRAMREEAWLRLTARSDEFPLLTENGEVDSCAVGELEEADGEQFNELIQRYLAWVQWSRENQPGFWFSGTEQIVADASGASRHQGR